MQKTTPLSGITQFRRLGGVEGMFHYGPMRCTAIRNMAKTWHINVKMQIHIRENLSNTCRNLSGLLILTSVNATTQAKMQCINKVYVHLLSKQAPNFVFQKFLVIVKLNAKNTGPSSVRNSYYEEALPGIKCN
jgi:hypothetical protein